MFGGNQARNSSPVQREDLSAFADGALPQSRAQVVAEHLRQCRDSADVVYQYWRQDGELLAEFSEAGVEPPVLSDSAVPRSRLPSGGWWQSIAASVLFATGIWIGGVTDLVGPRDGASTELQEETLQGAGKQAVAAPVLADNQQVAPMTVGDSGEASDSVSAQRESGPSRSSAPSVAALTSEPALSLPDPNTLPKSQLSPPPQSQTFHFTGADGVQLTLVKSVVGATVNEPAIERPSLSGGDEVKWMQADSLLRLSGNLEPAGLLLVAMQLRAQHERSSTGAAGAGLQVTPGSSAEQQAALTESASVPASKALHNL